MEIDTERRMIDPREDKLPKWAKDLLEQERRKAALGWPQVERPEPTRNVDNNSIGGRLRPGWYWRVQGGWGSSHTVKRVWVNGLHEYPHEPAKENRWSGGAGLQGPYYDTEREARAEAWWREAEAAAANLAKVAASYQGAGDA